MKGRSEHRRALYEACVIEFERKVGGSPVERELTVGSLGRMRHRRAARVLRPDSVAGDVLADAAFSLSLWRWRVAEHKLAFSSVF
jgi:hypothetical protein